MKVPCIDCGSVYEVDHYGEFICPKCGRTLRRKKIQEIDYPSDGSKNTTPIPRSYPLQQTSNPRPKKSVLVQFLNGIGVFASAASVFFIFIGVSSVGSGDSGLVFIGILATLFVALILFSTAKIISLLEIIAKK